MYILLPYTIVPSFALISAILATLRRGHFVPPWYNKGPESPVLIGLRQVLSKYLNEILIGFPIVKTVALLFCVACSGWWT